MLTTNELARYQRHLTLPGFGKAGQEKLKSAQVLVVGSGGLGSPVLLYLAAAGVGTIGIVDFDQVDETNLQRQVLFRQQDIGISKAILARQRIKELNPYINVEVYEERLTSENALEIIEHYDLVIDGTDNFPTRYLINDACVISDKPYIYGSIFRFEGQVAVFNYKGGATYRDLYPEPPEPDSVPNCAEGGVIGVLPGIIGCMQANEAIKVLTETGQPLAGRLLIFDALVMETRTISIPKNKNLPKIDKLIDYEEFCSGPQTTIKMKEITVQELKAMQDSGENFQLLDVREPHEYDIANLNGELIPMQQVPEAGDKIARDKKVVVHCRSGARSAQAIKFWESKHGLDNLYNLKGGILAWAREIDPEMAQY
ncbi:Sulfur carrier protein adenylyltransferase ThiF [Fulvivirga imtechensis AK7]|uniref:Molybdopterin-synthase adenylyltransferase n=1 Tax=Fulvivirga imtechensis AK7 TaxID=1237149 RepID=L8K032_9BACT|nr:molybdopterin-synthase adenylyltransferase MoeB [Fulvivirga imtechensis]ELR73738.1 Sulfur carrier protein adenylyltransferase ThiF [Fulvivirga imtechensis AK7]